MNKRKQKHIVKLSDEQKSLLEGITKKGSHNARVIKRAKILLKSAEGFKDKDIAILADTNKKTVERVRVRFVEEGIDRALYDNPRSGYPAKITPDVEAHLVAVACSNPPEGRTKWTLELLQERMVKDKKIESISKVSLWKHLDSRGIKPWLEKNVVHSGNNGRIQEENGRCS